MAYEPDEKYYPNESPETTALRERGYRRVSSATVFQGGEDLKHHIPCGAAVFNADAHDKVCPARV